MILVRVIVPVPEPVLVAVLVGGRSVHSSSLCREVIHAEHFQHAHGRPSRGRYFRGRALAFACLRACSDAVAAGVRCLSDVRCRAVVRPLARSSRSRLRLRCCCRRRRRCHRSSIRLRLRCRCRCLCRANCVLRGLRLLWVRRVPCRLVSAHGLQQRRQRGQRPLYSETGSPPAGGAARGDKGAKELAPRARQTPRRM